MYKKGAFIVIEGTDGSGKGTQFKLLSEALQRDGYDVVEFDFPQYDEPSSFFVQQYLNGNYGSSNEVNPYMGSLFYSLDRYHASAKIKQALKDGKIVLSNRFIGSNMGHQGQKFPSQKERIAYYNWLENIEFVALKIPKPDVNFMLDVPAEIAQNLVDNKQARSYTDKKRDIHEADIEHLKRAVYVYEELCDLFPGYFVRIDCANDGKILPVEKIHNKLKEAVINYLPEKPKKYLEKTDSGYKITLSGYSYLKDLVTDTKGSVYALTEKLSPVTAAAAYARLSRRFDDLRVTILDEFSGDDKKQEDLLKRVITAYGDDSVQQLVGQYVVVEGASILLTKKLEWGRLAGYLEQSTRYIYYDQKDNDGRYKYYIPENLPAKIKREYQKTMDKIFDNYSLMVHEMTDCVRKNSKTATKEQDGPWLAATRAKACDAIRAVLPVATKSTVGIYASGQALENMIIRLLADELDEARDTGQKVLTEARKVIPVFLERADKPDRGGATTVYLASKREETAKLAKKLLPQKYTPANDPVTLVDYYPKNELAIVPDILFEHSDMSLEAITKEYEKWPYKQKEQVLKAYFGDRLNRRQRPGRALEKIRYDWELFCEFAVFKDLMRHRMVEDMEWQNLTPRYGYEIPEIVEQAGLSEKFIECFDLSLELYNLMQKAGYELEAQYATLHGHIMRWKISYNAREAFHIHELRTSPQGHPNYRKIVNIMHEKLLNVHPLIGEAMKFVNQDEDPELNRLAAERYTAYKLKNLEGR